MAALKTRRTVPDCEAYCILLGRIYIGLLLLLLSLSCRQGIHKGRKEGIEPTKSNFSQVL